MWHDRRLLDLLGIEHPIIQAPMAGASGVELVAAVNAAGALGSFGAAATPAEQLTSTVEAIKRSSDRPFNVNLFAPATESFDPSGRAGPKMTALLQGYHRELGLGAVPKPAPLFGPAEQQLNTLLDQQVPVISFHFGIDRHTVDRIHQAGGQVLCTATTVAEAVHLETAGVDAIIAQGSEAGGHRGTFSIDCQRALIGTLALVPQVVDAVAVPVIAAGGIMDGRGLVACLALGASAVQMGTAFLGCPEAPVSAAWREALSRSAAEDTVVTEAMSGRAARGIRNRYITEVEALGEPLLPFPAQYAVSGNIRKTTRDTNNSDFMALWAGQGVGLYQRRSAAELIAEWVAEAERLIGRLGGNAN